MLDLAIDIKMKSTAEPLFIAKNKNKNTLWLTKTFYILGINWLLINITLICYLLIVLYLLDLGVPSKVIWVITVIGLLIILNWRLLMVLLLMLDILLLLDLRVGLLSVLI